MLRSRLFWKLFLGFTAVNLLSAVALVNVAWRWQSTAARDRLESEIFSIAVLLAERAPLWFLDIDSTETGDQLGGLSKSLRADIELLDLDGHTIAAAHGDPHAGVANAKWQTSIRPVSDKRGERLGTLRVARRQAGLESELAGLWRLYGLYALIATLLMIGVGYGVVAHLVRPVRTLERAAVAMARGDYNQRAFVPNRDELGALARSFNQMSQELGDQLTALRESDRRQATVLGGMIEGVIAIDERLYVLFANTAAGKLFGFLPPQVVGKPLLEVVRNRPLHEAVTVAIASSQPQRFDMEWEDRNLSVQVTPLVGTPTAGAVAVLHDTTELRRLESLRRDFVANVSHELKTPLSSIKAYTETLLGSGADDAEFRRRSLHRIEEQADRLAQLIADMLSLARIESAEQPLEIQTVGVAQAVGAVLLDHQAMADSKRLSLRAPRDESGEAEARVRADPEGLRVILNNLVDNAIKYTPEGGEVRVTWRRLEGDTIRIDVSDTGIGIPGDKVDRVFERFYRVDEARSDKMGGAGLGLSIVKHLARSFGGAVSVESRPDAGATFSVALPAA